MVARASKRSTKVRWVGVGAQDLAVTPVAQNRETHRNLGRRRTRDQT